MKRIALCGFVLSLPALLLAGCQTSENQRLHTYQIESIETKIVSRGVRIPATYVRPASDEMGKFPLVVMAHGHGGTRDEAGGFTDVAEKLAARGIASIRMDFSGCGDSSEPFTRNNLTNMLMDVRASRKFAQRQSNVDPDRIGLLGYSMGGRLAMLASAQGDRYSVMTAWAPAGTNGEQSLLEFLGGRPSYDRMKAVAARNGFATFTTPWGQRQRLSERWFADLEKLRPLDAIREFEGPLLVLCGERDEVVSPVVCQSVVAAAVTSAGISHIVIANADHGLGFYSGDHAIADRVVDATVQFLSQHLLPE
ncbi:MAG: alpha/beta hydrolase family protein [Woeseia sp.]